MTTLVYFKKFDEGDIIALFPEFVSGKYIMSYQHIGQHGDACPSLMKSLTDVDDSEYSELLNELTNVVGYDDLRVITNIKEVNHA